MILPCFLPYFLTGTIVVLSNKASTYKYDQIKILHIRSGCQDTKKRGEKWQWHHAGKDKHLAKLNQNITESDRKEWETTTGNPTSLILPLQAGKCSPSLSTLSLACKNISLEKILPAKTSGFRLTKISCKSISHFLHYFQHFDLAEVAPVVGHPPPPHPFLETKSTSVFKNQT